MSLSHHGLSYPSGLLDALKVHQQRPLPHPPIRILDGPSFASIHLRHLTTHAPDSVLFPFLHGLEGSNQAQNLFFSHGTSPGGRLKPAQVPPYRGLIWVVCDQDLDPDLPMPGPQSRDSSDDDEDEDDDLDDECFSDGSSYVVDPDQFAMDVDQDLDVHIHRLGESGFEFPDADDSDHGHSHMHPVAHRPGHVTSKTPVPVVVDTALTGSYHSLERRDSLQRFLHRLRAIR
jgi:dual specificity MAP kinase phosphatase